MDFRDYIQVISTSADPAPYGVYPRSVNQIGEVYVFMARAAEGDTLVCTSCDLDFEGECLTAHGAKCLIAPLTHANACVLRRLFPFTAPVPVLGRPRTIGVGDRLGIATPGHIRVFERYDATPVLAQQSMRELDLTGRTYEEVLDCVTFSVFSLGYKGGFGADGDHLKTPEDIQMALETGYSMITLDCSEHIRAGKTRRKSAGKTLEALYLGKEFRLGNGGCIAFDAQTLAQLSYTYEKAIRFAVEIYREFFQDGKSQADFELSIDETETPTTPQAHFFVANELIRQGVRPATIAPRFCGEFQKGIDYIGNLEQFERELAAHVAIARHFDYKLSIHSGSDKFSIFPAIGKETGGVFHLKTAGTSWLEAMRVAAIAAPGLSRSIYRYAYSVFDQATRYYHVTTDLNRIPDFNDVSDAQLPQLFEQPDFRQMIHITYGLILNHKDDNGEYVFKNKLYRLWRTHAEEYAQALEAHIGKHLQLLGVEEREKG